MKYGKPLLIKIAVTLPLLFVVLGLFFGASFLDILIIAVVLTLVAFVGDMLILPRVGNIAAAVGDFVLAFLVVWLLGTILFDANYHISVVSAAFLSALFVFGSELYYHRYLRDHIFNNVDFPNNYSRTHSLQTEFSEDFDKGIDKEDSNMS